MPNSTEKELMDEVWNWDMKRCLDVGKVSQCFPPGIQDRINNNFYTLVEGGIVHMNLRHYLVEYFEKLEKQNGKDES